MRKQYPHYNLAAEFKCRECGTGVGFSLGEMTDVPDPKEAEQGFLRALESLRWKRRDLCGECVE